MVAHPTKTKRGPSALRIVLIMAFTWPCSAVLASAASDLPPESTKAKPPSNAVAADCASFLLGTWPGQHALQELQVALPSSYPFFFAETLDATLAQTTLEKIFQEIHLARPDLDTQQAQFDYFLSAAFLQLTKVQDFTSPQETSLHPLLGPLAYLGHYILQETNPGLARDFFRHARHAYLSSVFSYIAAAVKKLSPRYPDRAINLNQVINILLPAQGLKENDAALEQFFKIFTQYAQKAERLKFAARPSTKEQDTLSDDLVSLDGPNPLQQVGEASLKLINQQILRLVLAKINLPKMLFLALPHHAALPAIKFIHLALQGHQFRQKILATNPLLQAIWGYLEAQMTTDSSPEQIDEHRQQIRQAFYQFIFTLTLGDDHSAVGKNLNKLQPFLAQQYQQQVQHWKAPGDNLKWQLKDQIKPLLEELDQIIQDNPQASGEEREVLGGIVAHLKDAIPPETRWTEAKDLSMLRRLQNELYPYGHPLLSFAAPGSLFKYDLQQAYQAWAAEGENDLNGHLNPEQSEAFQGFIQVLESWYDDARKPVVAKHFPLFIARFIKNWQTAVGKEKQARRDFLTLLAQYQPLNLAYYVNTVFNFYGVSELGGKNIFLPPVIPWGDLLLKGLQTFCREVPAAELDETDIIQVEDLLGQMLTAMGDPLPDLLPVWKKGLKN